MLVIGAIGATSSYTFQGRDSAFTPYPSAATRASSTAGPPPPELRQALRYLDRVERALKGQAAANANAGPGPVSVDGTDVAIAGGAGSGTSAVSSERISAVGTTLSTRTPAWTGAAVGMQITISGTYDGSLGTGELSFETHTGGTYGDAQAPKINVLKPNGTRLTRIDLDDTADPGDVHAIGAGLSVSFPNAQTGIDSTAKRDLASATLLIGYIDPDATFDGSGGSMPGFEPGLDVVAGSFTIDGETIAVAADDSVSTVIDAINASGAGVSASLDVAAQTITLERDAPGSGDIVLSADSSGFLAAVKLDGAISSPGEDPSAARPIDQVAELASVSTGTLTLNGAVIAIDVGTDSIEDIVARINASAAGVTASLVDDAGTLTLTLQASGGQIDIADTSGLLPALGIGGTSYTGVGGGGDASAEADQTARRTRLRSYRAADALEDLNRVLTKLLLRDGSTALAGAVETLVAELQEHYGEEKLDRIGLTFDGDDGYFDLSRTERRRFTQAMQRDDSLLERLLFDGYGSRNEGLVEALERLLRDELERRAGAGERGLLIDTFA